MTGQHQYPCGGYEWLEPEQCSNIVWKDFHVATPGSRGYILEVDLECPQDLEFHKYFSDYPLAPQTQKIAYKDLSPYSKKCFSRLYPFKKKESFTAEKLTSNFLPKKKYSVHYLLLAFYLRMGMKMTKIHRVLTFIQQPYFDHFMQILSEKKSGYPPKSLGAKRLKTVMCSQYGKQIENLRNYLLAKFTTKSKHCRKLMSHPLCCGYRILKDDVAVIYQNPSKVVMNRCFQAGFCVLELSKLFMYKAFYEHFIPLLGRENVSLVLTDTDSFILHCKGPTRREIYAKMSGIMDYSNFPKDHEFYDASRKGKIGFFKDECCGAVMTEVVALKSKTYCYEVWNPTSNGKEENKICKGINRAAKNDLTLSKYRACISDVKSFDCTYSQIRSSNHVLSTIELSKIALSSYDDKRYVMRDNATLPYGSMLIDREKDEEIEHEEEEHNMPSTSFDIEEEEEEEIVRVRKMNPGCLSSDSD